VKAVEAAAGVVVALSSSSLLLQLLPVYLKSNQLWQGKAFSSSVMQNMSQGRAKETEIEAIWRESGFRFSVTTTKL
jgi:hypothetical protein